MDICLKELAISEFTKMRSYRKARIRNLMKYTLMLKSTISNQNQLKTNPTEGIFIQFKISKPLSLDLDVQSGANRERYVYGIF